MYPEGLASVGPSQRKEADVVTSMSRRRATMKQQGAATEREIAQTIVDQRADSQAEHQRAVAAYDARDAARRKFTREEIVGAVMVRSEIHGWRKVRRVNAKSVSVDSGYSWPDYIPFKDVIAVAFKPGTEPPLTDAERASLARFGVTGADLKGTA